MMIQDHDCHTSCQWFLDQANALDNAVLRQFGKHRYLLHAFSGRRTVGDFQYFLERAMSDEQTDVLHVISLDVVVMRLGGMLPMHRHGAFGLRQSDRVGYWHFLEDLLANPGHVSE